MKVVVKPIDMVTWTDKEGNIHPVRFRLQQDDESYQTIKISKVLFKATEKVAGSLLIVYRCQSMVSGLLKVFEVRYELKSCKWVLYKI